MFVAAAVDAFAADAFDVVVVVAVVTVAYEGQSQHKSRDKRSEALPPNPASDAWFSVVDSD